MKKIALLILFFVLALSTDINAQDNKEVNDTSSVKTPYIPDVLPEYKGGNWALMDYIKRNLKYPSDAAKEGTGGRVIVDFIIGKDGKVRDAKVRNSIHPSLDKEALRIVSRMPKWKPGTQNGNPVDVSFTLPIVFNPDRNQMD